MSKIKSSQKTFLQQNHPLSEKRLATGIFLVALILYGNTLWHDFTLDDAIVITENTFTKQGIRGITDILRHDTFYGYFNVPGKAGLVSGGRYRPLSQVMFALEYEFFGLAPFWGHLINVLLYGFTCFSVFWLTLQLGKSRVSKKTGLWFASATALLFTAHPVHTEVVANIKGRDEILAMICVIWAGIWMLKINTDKNRFYYIWGGILFFLGLLAKEIAISFLIVIPLMYYFFVSRKSAGILRIVLTMMTALIAYLAIRFSILGFPGGGSPPMELMNNPFLVFDHGKYIPLTFIERIPNVLYSLLKYVQLLFIPHPLTHDYYPRHIPLVGWGNPLVLLSIVLFGTLLILVVLGGKKRSIWSFSILYFAVTIFLVSNILFPVGTNLSERFLFLPSLGWAMAMGALFDEYRKRKMLYILLIGILLLFAAKTFSRNAVWKDNFTLFTTDVVTSGNSAKARNAAGGEYIAKAMSFQDSTLKVSHLKKAIEHLNKAIEIHPYYKNAFLLLGNAYYYLQEFEKAISFYDQALQIDENYQEALGNRAITFRDFGRYYGEIRRDLLQAIKYLEAAVQYLEDDFETIRLLGVAYGNYGNHEKSISYFIKAIDINPEDVQNYYNLSQAYFASGDEMNGNKYLNLANSMDKKIE